MNRTHYILIQNSELIIFYNKLSEEKKKEISFILLEYGFNVTYLEEIFKIPRFLLIHGEKIDMAKIVGQSVGISLLHEQSKHIINFYPEQLYFPDIYKHSKLFASFIVDNRQEIISVLINYETHKVANDEIERTLDLLNNLNENSDYYQRRIGDLIAFLPRNQPLYALSCFGLILTYMTRHVSVYIPSSMKFFFPLLIEKLNLKHFFPNLLVVSCERKEIIECCSKLIYDPIVGYWRPKTDVVIFTGTPGNAKKVKSYFEDSVLFIANSAGHNPVVITQTADIEMATDAVIELQLYNQGQDCANPNSILVHQLIHDKFVKLLVKKLKKIKIGSYSDESCIVGPITKTEDLKKIQSILIKNNKWIHTETPGTIHIASRLVEPTIIVKPLIYGGNYTEQLSPIFFVQKYQIDEELKLYFDNQQYWYNAMYIMVYGKSDYVDNLIDYRLPNGNIIHDESTIIRNTHLHAKRVERGTKQYGGYGRVASWIGMDGCIIARPTLPQRDIYEQIVAPSIELEKVKNIYSKENNAKVKIILKNKKQSMEKVPQNNPSEEINSEKIPVLETSNKIMTMSERDWIHEVSDKILEVFPDKEVYTCAAGISPSGIVHFGNFRDVMTSLVFQKDLQARGKKARLLFSWDDFDRFRKVPANIDPSFNQYIGLPLTEVPDPTGETESYAKHLEKEFEESMKDLGIEMEYHYQTQEYKSGRYDDLIVKAMQARLRIAEILLSFMSDKGKKEKQIDPVKFREEYYPISVYSRFTGKDNTKIIDYDGESKVTYICLDTNQQEAIDLHQEHIAKLSWKIDWPMRWKEEGVVFEPGGHDHASLGGSYDVSSVIAKEVFDISPPVFVGYQFIGIRGLEGKMSGSKGNAITPAQLLKIYEPDLLKWLYLRKNPHQAFELAFDTEVYRQYDEYDRAMLDFLDKKEDSIYARSLSFIEEANNPKFKKPIPFKQAVAFGQILQWNQNKINALIKKMNLDYDSVSVADRLSKARAWLEEYNPKEMIKLRETINQEYVLSMNEDAKNLVRKLHSFLLETDIISLSVEKLEEALYHIPRSEELSSPELKKKQRAFFKDIYQLIIGQETGPRLPTFIWAVDKDKILKLINI